MATQSARTKPADKPTVTKKVAIVTHDDGTTEQFVIRPIHYYEMGEYLQDDETAMSSRKSGVLLTWLAAGKPGDDPFAWFATLLDWDMQDVPVPPTNGARRKA